MTENRSEFRKSLKGPDAFQRRFAGYLEAMRSNPQVIAAMVVPLVVIIAVYAGVSVWQHSKENSRIQGLGQIHVVYERESQQAEQRREELMARLDEVRAALTLSESSSDVSKVAELEQREAALNSEITAVVADRQESLAGFRAFFEENLKHPQGWAAGLMAVAVVLEAEQLEEARDLLRRLLSVSKGSTFYQTHGRISLIGVLEDLGAFDEALAEAKTLETQAPDSIKPMALLAQGRVLMLSGRLEEAREVFATLEANHGDSTEAQQARSMQSLLRG